jgi:uncharacterized repeat protein (TIGR01451 family)
VTKPTRVVTAVLAIALGLGWGGRADAGIGRWTSYGPEGGLVNVVAVDPQTPTRLYAGTDGGVFRRVNGGASWTAVSTGVTDPFVAALAVHPQSPTTLYAGTRGGGVFQSVNVGLGWTAVNSGLTNLDVHASAVDPQTPTTLYAGTDGSGVFKSVDAGANWAPVSTGLTTPDVYALAVDPQTPATVYAGTDGGVFKSTDAGLGWGPAITGLTSLAVRALAVDPQVPAALYAGTDGGGAFRSVDGGATWSAINAGLTNPFVEALAVDPQTPGIVYAGTQGGSVFVLQQVAPAVTLALAVSPATVQPGQVVRFDVAAANPGPKGLVEVYFGALLPPAMGPPLGCPAGDALVFLTEGFLGVVVACLGSPETFASLLPPLVLPAPLPPISVPGFFSVTWPPGLPPAPYVFFLAIVGPQAFVDGVVEAAKC